MDDWIFTFSKRKGSRLSNTYFPTTLSGFQMVSIYRSMAAANHSKPEGNTWNAGTLTAVELQSAKVDVTHRHAARNWEVKTLVKEKLTAEGLNLVKLNCSSGTGTLELIAIWAGKL